MNANAEIIAELRRVLNERDEARRERDEARAEVERLRETKDYLRTWLSSEELEGLRVKAAEHPLLWEEIHHLKAEVERLKTELDEARSKYNVLHDEADRALRAPLLALSAIVGGDVNFAPGPWDSQTRGMNALAERITRSFAIWRDREKKQAGEDFRRGAEAMR